MTIRSLLAATAMIVGVCVGAADAETIHFTYSGAAFGNSVLETGWVTIAGPAFRNSYGSENMILDAGVTVTGDGAANGFFGTADYAGSAITDWSPVALDMSRQLVGQPIGGGCHYGDSVSGPCGWALSGDFNLFPLGGGAPKATLFFQQTTKIGDNLTLTSLSVIPEASIWTMMALGFAGLGFAAFQGRRSAISIA